MSEQAWCAQTPGVGRNAGAPRAPSQPPRGPEMQFGASGFIPFILPSTSLEIHVSKSGTFEKCLQMLFARGVLKPTLDLILLLLR